MTLFGTQRTLKKQRERERVNRIAMQRSGQVVTQWRPLSKGSLKQRVGEIKKVLCCQLKVPFVQNPFYQCFLATCVGKLPKSEKGPSSRFSRELKLSVFCRWL